MKKTIVLAAALLIAAGASAQEKNFLDKPYIEVTGKADMEVTPDEIYVRIVINEKDNKGKVSVEQQEKEMFRRLKAAHIDIEKDLVVQDMSSDLQTYFLRKNAILSTKTYQLKVSSAAQLGQAFEALQAAGIADVNIERTDVSNMDELRQQVRADAAKAARKNAEVLAEAVGQTAGPAVYIQDYGYNTPRYANVMLMAKSAAVADAAGTAEATPNLEFEKIRIEHSVTVRFLLNYASGHDPADHRADRRRDAHAEASRFRRYVPLYARSDGRIDARLYTAGVRGKRPAPCQAARSRVRQRPERMAYGAGRFLYEPHGGLYGLGALSRRSANRRATQLRSRPAVHGPARGSVERSGANYRAIPHPKGRNFLAGLRI